jgi:hypothetical protein
MDYCCFGYLVPAFSLSFLFCQGAIANDINPFGEQVVGVFQFVK